ncbi:MAG: hypothetical protein FWF36_05900 [Propionibacteriaceae bacterium]|nr:hypothetical protein [Propionibacteriaceae bacterium]
MAVAKRLTGWFVASLSWRFAPNHPVGCAATPPQRGIHCGGFAGVPFLALRA